MSAVKEKCESIIVKLTEEISEDVEKNNFCSDITVASYYDAIEELFKVKTAFLTANPFTTTGVGSTINAHNLEICDTYITRVKIGLNGIKLLTEEAEREQTHQETKTTHKLARAGTIAAWYIGIGVIVIQSLTFGLDVYKEINEPPIHNNTFNCDTCHRE